MHNDDTYEHLWNPYPQGKFGGDFTVYFETWYHTKVLDII